MSVSYFIRYVGRPENKEEFFAYYRDIHSQFLEKYPNIRSCRLHHPVDWKDPVAVTRDEVLVLAELVFDSAEDLDAALQSEARQASRADFGNFPPLENRDIRHLAVETEIIF